MREIKIELEEVKKEWEALGFVWKKHPNIKEIFLFNIFSDCEIRIYTSMKTYVVKKCKSYEYQYLSIQEHQLLTKTFKMLGWEE